MSWDEVIFHKCNDDERRHEDKRKWFEDDISFERKRNKDDDKERDNNDLDFSGKGRKSLFGLAIGARVNVTLINGVELEAVFQGIVDHFALFLQDDELVRVNLKDIVTVSVV
ncbi:hypothetical protein [Priestia endophytica]|uniref:hypothetical protein n=1 Tax=Priestia endophytica TaxID=135735 RepID=UPI00124CEA97|nr:hypothetical protein [Priestia endophytica]KAB2488064.1 hypothetical protein F8155_25645 [Priestia endophytica]